MWSHLWIFFSTEKRAEQMQNKLNKVILATEETREIWDGWKYHSYSYTRAETLKKKGWAGDNHTFQLKEKQHETLWQELLDMIEEYEERLGTQNTKYKDVRPEGQVRSKLSCLLRSC